MPRIIQNEYIPDVSLDEEIGGTGAVLQAGKFTDEEFNKALKPFNARGTQGDHGIYDKMRRTDATVNGVLLSQELPIRAAEWIVEPPENADDEDLRVADFVADNLFNRLEGGWDSFLLHALLYLQYGFMLFERVYRRTASGHHVLKKLAPRMPWSVWKWVEDPDCNLVAVTQRVRDGRRWENIVIPSDKLLLLVNRMEGGNYEGVSAIRQAYGPWLKKTEIDKRDMINFERFGAGIPIFKEPPSFDTSDLTWKDDLDRLEEIGRNYRSHERSYLSIPRGWEFDIKFPSASGLNAQAKLKYYDHQILLNSLAMLMDLGNTETGSRSLGETFADLFMHSLRGHAKVVEEALNGVNGLPFTGIIPQMVDLNFGPRRRYPRIKATKLAGKAINVQLTSIADAVQKGILSWGNADENLLRDWLDLPSQTIGGVAAPVTDELPSLAQIAPGLSDDSSETVKLKGVSFLDGEGESFSAHREPIDLAERSVAWKSVDDEIKMARATLGKHVAPIVLAITEQFQEEAIPIIEAIRAGNDVEENVALLRGMSPSGMGDLDSAVRSHQREIVRASRKTVARELYRQTTGKMKEDSSLSLQEGDPLDLDPDLLEAASEAMADVISEADSNAPLSENAELFMAAAAGTASTKIFLDTVTILRDLSVKDALLGSSVLPSYTPPGEESPKWRAAATPYANPTYDLGREDGVELWTDSTDQDVQIVRYSAILDGRTCLPCTNADAIRFPYLSTKYEEYKPPYVNCNGGLRCRCIYIYELAAIGPPIGVGVV